MARRSSTHFIARVIPGAKPATYPGFVALELATFRARVPPGSSWIHETKFDGYRVQAHKVKDHVMLYTRNGHDWTPRFSPIAAEMARLPVERIIIDGEVVVTKDGRNNFSELQADLASGSGSPGFMRRVGRHARRVSKPVREQRRVGPDMVANEVYERYPFWTAVFWERMFVITTTSERIGHWIKMHRSRARFSRVESFVHTWFLVDFITITSESRFSVHTAEN